MLTKQEAEKRGWIVVSWEEPPLVPVAWTASGKRVSKSAQSERDLLRLVAHSISGSGSVIRSKTRRFVEMDKKNAGNGLGADQIPDQQAPSAPPWATGSTTDSGGDVNSLMEAF